MAEPALEAAADERSVAGCEARALPAALRTGAAEVPSARRGPVRRFGQRATPGQAEVQAASAQPGPCRRATARLVREPASAAFEKEMRLPSRSQAAAGAPVLAGRRAMTPSPAVSGARPGTGTAGWCQRGSPAARPSGLGVRAERRTLAPGARTIAEVRPSAAERFREGAAGLFSAGRPRFEKGCRPPWEARSPAHPVVRRRRAVAEGWPPAPSPEAGILLA